MRPFNLIRSAFPSSLDALVVAICFLISVTIGSMALAYSLDLKAMAIVDN